MSARPRRLIVRLMGLALVAALMASLAGCNQISAKRNHSRLQKILAEIQVHEGDERPYRFRNQEVLDLENAINQIGDLISRESYPEAAEMARRWRETAPTLRDSVIADHASHMRQRAEEDIQIAQENQGRSENLELWEVILQTQESMREANAEQDWESVIDDGQQIVDDVRTLLLNLRTRAQQGYNDAVNRMLEFEIYSAETYQPSLVVNSQTLTDTVAQQIEQRQYRLAIATAQQALTAIDETIFESMRSISDEGITYLESLIAEVVEHGGDFRLAERYRSFSENFEELLNFFYLQEYQQALAQIAVLTPVAQELLLDTYQREAEELIELRSQEIAQLREAEVDRYLPGRIDVAIQLHEQAQQRYDEALVRIDQLTRQMESGTFSPSMPMQSTQDSGAGFLAPPPSGSMDSFGETPAPGEGPADPFADPQARAPMEGDGELIPGGAVGTQGNVVPMTPGANVDNALLLDEVKPIFDDSVQLSVDAGEEIDMIHRAFRELAEQHLAEAQSSINVAIDVLGQFPTIWDPRVDRVSNSEDRQFEENKALVRQEVESRLDSAQILKVTADFRLADQRYNVAIQYADQARDDAEQVLADTYEVAARYALIELTWMVDHYEREGAGEYVTGELDRTVRLIERTRQTLESGESREAVAQAAEARSQLEIMIQALRRVANENIEQLRELERETEQVLGEINAAERLALISQLLAEAENLARNDQLKDSIETAQRGLRVAEQTASEAAREWAQNEIENSRSRISHATEAGAATYAAADLQDARDLADTARRRFEDGDYLAAQRTAAEAAAQADEARMYLITRAEEAAVEARDYEGWRLHNAALADALVANQRAMRAMNEGRFAESQELAIFANQRAMEITMLSRQNLFMERVGSLRDSIQHALRTGASYFQPEDMEAVLDDLAQIEVSYSVERHDDFARDLEALETRMAIIIEGTPEVLQATLTNQRDWIRQLRDAGADLYAYNELEAAAEQIYQAQANFDSGHFRQSYRSARQAGSILTGVQVMADEFTYKEAAERILESLEDARSQFAQYIYVTPPMMTHLAITPGGAGRMTRLASIYSPSEFRREVERLQGLASEIEAPPTRVDHRSELLACLENAELAARNFEYLNIADQMDERTVSQTIESAYEFLEASRRQSEDLTASLLEAPLAGPVTMTQMGRPFVERAMADFSYGHLN